MRANGKWLVVAMLLSFTSGCAHVWRVAGRPKVKRVRARITAIDLQGVSVAFDIDVHNPYPFPLRSPRFRYGIDVEGTELVRAEDTAEMSVPARAVGTVTLPSRIAYRSAWKTYQALSAAKEFAYRIRGQLILSGMGRTYVLPASHTGTLPVLRAPKFSNINVRFAERSPISATVIVEADIENPNIFALGIKDLGFVLKLGDEQVGNLTASTTAEIPAGKSGRLTLKGRIVTVRALLRLALGQSLGEPKIEPTGAIETSYGPVKLRKRE